MKNISYRSNGSRIVSTINNLPSRTDQQFKADCDVNHIVTKFKKTGQISHLAKMQGQYLDVSEIKDLDVALQQVKTAQSAFDSLPAEIRQRFRNDPREYVKFLADPKNDEEAITLGLKVKKQKPGQLPQEDAGDNRRASAPTKPKQQPKKTEPTPEHSDDD